MNTNQELRQTISELRGMTTFAELRDFMVKSMEEQLAPEEDEVAISTATAEVIDTMTQSEKVAVELHEAVQDLTEENALKALGAKKTTKLSKADFLALCDELLVAQGTE